MALGIESPLKDLGPCMIEWDVDGTPVDLTPAFGTVTFKSELKGADVFENGHGEAPVDTVQTGRVVTIEAPFTRFTISLMGTITAGSTAAGSTLDVPNKVGTSVYDLAKHIIIKPLVDDTESVTNTEWIHCFKAYPFEKFEIGYDNSDQKVFLVEFKCYPDDTSGNVGAIWRIGPNT
jgi:hypothetical protein